MLFSKYSQYPVVGRISANGINNLLIFFKIIVKGFTFFCIFAAENEKITN